MISASNKLQKKETRESRKLFQPPQLGSSSLLSSQELQQERFHGLSNVQEKSVLSSQNQNLDKRDIEEFIANMKMAEQYSEPLSPISHKPNPSRVRRIEAQNIVVQQDQIGSNSIGKESVILQHIDFNQEEKHQPQITPEWENHHNNYKHQGVNYTINYVQAAHNFLVQENQNISSQTPFDFTNSELKNPQVRHSKNTCVQHIDLGDSNHINHFKQKNKSCIAPANSQSNCQAQSSNQQDINHILKKWNNFIYPELSEEYLRKDVRQEKGNKKNIAYNLPTQGKSCVSNYEGIMQGEDFSDYKSTNKFKEEDKQTNTKQKSVDLKLKQYNDRIRQLEDKLKKKDDQNSRLFISQKKKQEELVYLRQNLKKKSEEILSLRYTVQPANQSANKQWYEECKRMESKNKELESIINEKNMTIRIYQEKLNVLQKKLYETVMNVQKNILTQQITTQASSVRMPQFDTFSQLSPRNSMQVNTHEVCNAKIEALQEYIFDMQQQRVGIDLQVQKRLKAVTQKIESQVRRNANEEFRVILLNLKEDNSKLRQINNQINLQRKEVIQQYQRKQAVILEREEKVKHMYEQLVSQWDQHEKIKEKSFQKKNNFASTITNPLLSSPRSANLYQTSFSKNQTSQLHSRFNSPPKGNNLLNKNFFSPTNPKSTINVTNYERDSSINYFKDYQTLLPSLRSNTINAIDNSIGFERMSFERESNNKSKEMGQSFGENCDLYIINSKIQKLRSEINRELDLIH